RGIALPGGVAGAPGAPGQPQGPPPIFKQEVRIVADDVTNSLVVLATKRDYQLILDVVRRLDVVPRQVVLEVTIAEIVLNKDLSFGVEYALAEGRLNQSIPILTSSSANLAAGVNTAIVNSVQYRDTGKILTILPQVNSKGLVNLQIRQEVSAVLAGATAFGNTNSPAFSTREAETTVVVQDGDSVLIGGILD